MRVLITGGAGFVGSHLARLYRSAGAEVVAFDNLKRRGSERNLAAFQREGIHFAHGDVRSASDLAALPGNFDLFVEASAEPSVHAGTDGSPAYLLDTNLLGTINCLEFTRARAGALIFLSTSRVYSIAPLSALPLAAQGTRLAPTSAGKGFSPKGITEEFPVDTARSLYGATKLCSEILLQEYAHTYGVKALVNRCGVIAGAGQFGKVDQGVFTLWIASHFFGKPLRYTGFGGKGHQVRDLLHPSDLYALLQVQANGMAQNSGRIFNVGGGAEISVSLSEWTQHAREATGREVEISSVPGTAAVDIPWYISDCALAEKTFGWRPQKSPVEIARDITFWLRENENSLRALFT